MNQPTSSKYWLKLSTTFLAISRAFLFNAEFEDHAEHVYAKFVEDHPEWDEQEVKTTHLKEYGEYEEDVLEQESKFDDEEEAEYF